MYNKPGSGASLIGQKKKKSESKNQVQILAKIVWVNILLISLG